MWMCVCARACARVCVCVLGTMEAGEFHSSQGSGGNTGTSEAAGILLILN